MNDSQKNILKQTTAIAVAQQADKLQAVCVAKHGRRMELVWAKSSDMSRSNWQKLTAECRPQVERAGSVDTEEDRTIVAGFDSAGVVLYRMLLPAAGQQDIATMVRLQAEARLPLPLDQMELGWRAGNIRDGQVPVTVAAARKEQLMKFVENIREIKPDRILLDYEAIVKVWMAFFAGGKEPAVVISMGQTDTRLCLAEAGELINAATIDVGVSDITAASETAERFAQDVVSVLELFGYSNHKKVAVCVLSDGGGVIEGVTDCLKSAGLNAEICDFRFPISDCELSENPDVVYEYRVAIGLALMALEADKGLNLFEGLYKPFREKRRLQLYSVKTAGVIAAAMSVLLIIAFYLTDVAGLNAIERQLNRSNEQTQCSQLIERQKLVKTVARQRPDLLDLLSQITTNDSKGIELDSLHFRKGQPVRITGQAKAAEQLYKFEKALQDKKTISDVKIQSAPENSKGKNIRFTITFHYRNFTKKQARI